MPLPQSRRDLHREIETISYINDKPSVRRAIEPFHYQRDQWNESLSQGGPGKGAFKHANSLDFRTLWGE